ncbi:MAG: ABC transporter permease [Candidatus Hodarchaeales archaeon]
MRSFDYLDSRSAKLRAFTGAVKKEFTILTRYPVSLVCGMGQVIIIMGVFILAVPLFSGSSDTGSAVSVSTAMTWGFVLFMLFTSAMQDIGTSLRNEQVEGTLESLYLTPANMFLNLCSRISVTTFITLLFSITGIVMISLVIGTFYVTNIIAGVLIFAMTAFGFSFMLAGLSIRIKDAISSWINLMQFGMMIFCAMFFPFSALGPLKFVSYFIPLSYYVDLFRSTLMGYPAGFPELVPLELIWIEWAIVVFLAVITPVIGYRIYKKQVEKAKIKGNLATY